MTNLPVLTDYVKLEDFKPTINPVDLRVFSTEKNVCGLKNWGVFLVTRNTGGCSIHLVGEFGTQGLVTSPVITYEKRIANTANRKYVLIGKSGLGRLATYTWKKWLETYKITNYRDITNKY